MAKHHKSTGRTTLLPITRYEYRPPAGNFSEPVVIHGLKDYSPGDHSGRVDRYRVVIPTGMIPGEDEVEFDTRDGMIESLKRLFSDDQAERRLTRVWADQVHFPLTEK